ncbi:hypothetical protein Pint_22713 [Pistacia integerrima]|uniref:Uncharacterized protein n=1 Tax=Pistacia integerrima TaxID=434235 RepID=A0ACC0YN21_9ROSI|nr:hypothetical protein Pint_22713 [Pistacia integerrima]
MLIEPRTITQPRNIVSPYDPVLIKAWEHWDDQHVSENDHPRAFPKNQCYVVFVLQHGGKDLESFVLLNFDEARSLLVQVTAALAVAESANEVYLLEFMGLFLYFVWSNYLRECSNFWSFLGCWELDTLWEILLTFLSATMMKPSFLETPGMDFGSVYGMQRAFSEGDIEDGAGSLIPSFYDRLLYACRKALGDSQ